MSVVCSDEGFGVCRVRVELPKVVKGLGDPLLDWIDEKVVF